MNDPLPCDQAGKPVNPLQALPDEPQRCPRCQSIHVETRSYGKKIGGAIGAAAGMTGGVAVILSGAEVGATVGALAGPAGIVAGGLVGSVLAVLMSGAAGCAVGAAFGDVIDETVLHKHRCEECAYVFSNTNSSA